MYCELQTQLNFQGWTEYMFVTRTQSDVPAWDTALAQGQATYIVVREQKEPSRFSDSVSCSVPWGQHPTATWTSALTRRLILVLQCPPHFSNLHRTSQQDFFHLYQPESLACFTTKSLYPCCYKTKPAVHEWASYLGRYVPLKDIG